MIARERVKLMSGHERDRREDEVVFSAVFCPIDARRRRASEVQKSAGELWASGFCTVP